MIETVGRHIREHSEACTSDSIFCVSGTKHGLSILLLSGSYMLVG